MSETKIALVTGANKGIGYEIAAGLGALGYRVGVGARDGARLESAVEKLRAAGADAFGVPLEVTGDRSVTAAAELVRREAGRLDVLVNNAGISGETGPGWVQDPTALDLDLVRRVLETNVLGVIRVTNAMLPLLRLSASPRIVNVSSSVGSVTRQADPAVQVGPVMAAYAPSKIGMLKTGSTAFMTCVIRCSSQSAVTASADEASTCAATKRSSPSASTALVARARS